jgi:hypothetical protein
VVAIRKSETPEYAMKAIQGHLLWRLILLSVVVSSVVVMAILVYQAYRALDISHTMAMGRMTTSAIQE